MRTSEIMKIYKEIMPVTRVEFKKLLGKQFVCPDIVNDLLAIERNEWREVNGIRMALVNAINLGVIIGKKSERNRRKLDLFGPVESIDIKKEQISKSIKMWQNMNERDLLEVITELKSMTNENEWYQLKESLLSQAIAIFYHNFIKEGTHERID